MSTTKLYSSATLQSFTNVGERKEKYKQDNNLSNMSKKRSPTSKMKVLTQERNINIMKYFLLH